MFKLLFGPEIKTVLEVAEKPTSKWTEQDKKYINSYQKLYGIVLRLDSDLAEAKGEIQKLTIENAFMLRLINDKIKD